MAIIPTDKLQAGMVLAADVQDLNGRMLLKLGTIVEEKHLKVLRTWGVMSVDIENNEDIEDSLPKKEIGDLSPEIIKAIDCEIEKRFKGVDVRHPVMTALVDVVKKDLIEQHLTELPAR
ncbi:MAG: hypothetical protein OQK78_07660 [Gammaproteobacteria bacterium]|nr:hypothetical protein [Gammaproteobacteria bacterium]